MTTTETNLPTHLGLILDGNRRWAKERGLKPFEGHRRGYLRLREIALAAFDHKIKYVSAFVFSTENWNRSTKEVTYLMDLLNWVATSEIKKLDKKDIKVIFLGTKVGLSQKIIKSIKKAEELTKNNKSGTLALCLNYGGQQELSDAFSKIIKDKIDTKDINPKLINKYLYGPDLPPLDLIIRTSGEQRLSGFMLWQAAYAELKFVLKNWPAFTVTDLDDALKDYASRKRRFGT
ncbi:MAG: polyprenyl diphosphate synthase [Patescibacteria group bacterium]|jgi:undecaprenyl diphosphate synthase|nr:polyprenyl diphosphate synthase [Patescibacteria group bacterium]